MINALEGRQQSKQQLAFLKIIFCFRFAFIRSEKLNICFQLSPEMICVDRCNDLKEQALTRTMLTTERNAVSQED